MEDDGVDQDESVKPSPAFEECLNASCQKTDPKEIILPIGIAVQKQFCESANLGRCFGLCCNRRCRRRCRCSEEACLRHDVDDGTRNETTKSSSLAR